MESCIHGSILRDGSKGPCLGEVPCHQKKKKGTHFLKKIKQKAIGPVSFGLNGTSSCKSKVEGEIVTREHKRHLVHL